jgi:CheY-like chemotaxis protein
VTIPASESLHTVSADPGASDPWLVLVVDDEPAVHEVTRMLLARFLFEGRPLELRHAVSAAGAREFLSAHPQTALVILDVVMETDDAGLNLCHYIRETLGNRDVQIVLRTGQPGHAPERTVVRDYDINGYYLKTELTAQKLQSMVICALRAWTNAGRLRRASAVRAPTARTRSGQAEEVVSSLGSSIVNNHLQLSWCPMVGLDDGRLRGVEVQASWRTETGDEISGNALETLAEGEGLARQLGHWLLHKACEDVAQWGSLGGERFRLSRSTGGRSWGWRSRSRWPSRGVGPWRWPSRGGASWR